MNNKLLPEYIIEFEYSIDAKSYYQMLFSKAILDLNWNIGEINSNHIKATTTMSLSSWSEQIDITLFDNKAIVSSKCIGNQILDWGKNKENVELLIQKIEFLKTEINISSNNLETENSENFKEDNLKINSLKKEKSLKDFFTIFIPTKDYIFTPLLIIANILFFVIMAIDGTNIIEPQGEKLIFWGANVRELTINGEWWRLVSCMFIHIGILHLLMNLYALIFIGMLLEPLIGKNRFIVAYLITGFIASTASLYWNTFAISAGASGAIFGLFGVFLALLTTTHIEKSVKKPMLIYISIYIGINLINGLKEGIDAASHLGGLVSGFVIGYVYYYGMLNKENRDLNYWILGIVSFLGVSTSFLVIESIPNPLKYYQFEEESTNTEEPGLKYFKLYETQMKDFEANEVMAMEMFTFQGNNKESYLYQIKDRSLYFWKENLEIVRKIEKYSLPKEILDHNKLVKKYVILRIKQNDMFYNTINLETERYKKDLIEVQQEIDNILFSLQ